MCQLPHGRALDVRRCLSRRRARPWDACARQRIALNTSVASRRDGRGEAPPCRAVSQAWPSGLGRRGRPRARGALAAGGLGVDLAAGDRRRRGFGYLRGVHSSPLVADFFALYAAFDEGAQPHHRGFPLPLVALSLSTCRGRGVGALVQATRAGEAAIARRLAWHSALSSQLNLVIVAQLVRRGVDAESFYDEFLRVRGLFRAGRVRRDEPREAMATLLLREVASGGEVTGDEVDRLRAIYEALKGHHWFLTGADDLPACALLVAEAGTPAAIADGVEAIYEALQGVGLSPGDPLQRVAMNLYLGPREGACDRIAALRRAFGEVEQPLRPLEYPGLSLLGLLTGVDAASLSAEVGELKERLIVEVGSTPGQAFNIAASLVCLGRGGADAAIMRILDLELMLMAYFFGVSVSRH